MNSFALLQDDVEDPSVPAISAKAPVPEPPAVQVEDAQPQHPKPVPDEPETTEDAEPKEEEQEQQQEQEKEMSFEEFIAKKKALSSGLQSLNSRGARQANDGRTPFARMNLLKKNEDPDDGSIMGNVPVKETQENKGLKDSTQATVARNAEIQKFFQKEPTDRRLRDARRGYGERRGRGRGERGRGRGRGRGGYRGDRERYNRDSDRTMNGGGSEQVPNVDDTAAFPSL